MEAGGGGKQSRLLSRLFSKFRGDHHKYHANVSPPYGLGSTIVFRSSNCIGIDNKAGTMVDTDSSVEMTNEEPNFLCEEATTSTSGDKPFRPNIDLRYGGQYLTAEQLPEFCEQLHHLVDMIRNIQSYATVTGEYPRELECQLEQEAREVAALAAEARNARDVVARTRLQRRAVRAQRRQIVAHLTTLRESEIRELESSVRLSDRKLFKCWEALKEANDVASFEPLLEEIRNKQTALECLVRLIETRRSVIVRNSNLPQPLPLPSSNVDREDSNSSRRRHQEMVRRGGKRRRGARPASVPLSEEPSLHTSSATGTLSTSRYQRVNSVGTLEPSVRDIFFFTTGS